MSFLTTTTRFDQTFIASNSTSLYPIIDLKCEKYADNNTGRFIKEYNGIPENLIINLIVWFILLVLFTFLRRVGDYGRFGMLQRDHEEERWSTLLYTHSVDESMDSTASTSTYKDEHSFSWLVNIFRLKDKHILEKCGKDALYYLEFQRYLIVYVTFVTIVSISIILPINYSGNIISDKKVFGSTTIINVPPNSPVLWVHLIVSWVFLILGFVLMRFFSKRMRYTESEYVSRTAMIMNIPKNKCDPDLIKKHFTECYTDLQVHEIQPSYELSDLYSIEQERHKMQTGRITSQRIYDETNQRPQMYPFHGGSLFEVCCCCCQRMFYKTDAIEYYTDCEKYYKEKLNIAKQISLNNPLGIVFVTFKNEDMAASFLKHYQNHSFNTCHSCCCACTKSSYVSQIHSSVSDELDTQNWHVQYAPAPHNIKWENLSQIDSTWRVRYIAINVLLLIVMIFFTTPSILIDTFSRWSHSVHFDDYLSSYLPAYLTEFLPSLLLRLFSALLPVIAGYTALLEKHWTKSAQNHSVMIKTFVVLLFMVLILPTFGLTSIDALITFWFDKSETDKSFKWKCVSDNGAFFVKYITTCMLIGTALDLLRLPDLFMYFMRLFWSRSLSERMAVRVQVANEFDYGTQYAWILTVFTTTICFSVVCPFITPFGLIYLILKHFVDRYNIYFAYIYSKVDKKIHKSAVSFFISSVIMLQFCILFFIAIRNGDKDVMLILQSIIICIAVLLFFGHMSFGWFKKLSLFSKKNMQKPNDTETIPGDDGNNVNAAESSVEIVVPQPLAESTTEVPRVEMKSPFVPILLQTVTPLASVDDFGNCSMADTISHFSDTNTLDGGELDQRRKQINESTMSISSKYGTVTIED